ncbi:MAG: hypothetical protein AAF385_11550, partial [Pseudomonadota bacterium]
TANATLVDTSPNFVSATPLDDQVRDRQVSLRFTPIPFEEEDDCADTVTPQQREPERFTGLSQEP